MVSRIKILAKLNIGERRLPQDGSFTIKMGHKSIDIRVATIPTIYGEKVVMRLLNKDQVALELANLGLYPDQEKIIKKVIKYPYGLIFITGPTGSGKTTTL